jgi:hypothetical protein
VTRGKKIKEKDEGVGDEEIRERKIRRHRKEVWKVGRRE